MKTAVKYAEEIREFRPIEFQGLKFYPLQVKHFALYQNAKPAMELMISTLPLRFVRLDWIHALEALDLEAKEKKIKTGFFGSVLLLLDAALRTDALHQKGVLLPLDGKDGKFAMLAVKQDGKTRALNAKDFAQVREILAAQNGYTIPDENWNPELVKAQAYLREQESATARGGSLEDAVFALAAATGQRAAEIWDWPLREYTQMQNAVDRRLRFMLYGAAELSGQVKFTKGNPYPTWIWENRSGLPRGFISLKELDDGAKGLLGTPTT